MGFFDTEKGVNEYITMSEGYDGAELVRIFENFLPKGSTVLELGMGPGKDLDLLQKNYVVVGSDNSIIFLEKYKRKNHDSNLLFLDAVTLKTDRLFDGIYSNKVLHHLTTEDLKTSLKKQKQILNPGGILFHSFWRGNKIENMEGLLFVYYEMEKLKQIFEPDFEILAMETYTEMEKDDSIYAVLKKK